MLGTGNFLVGWRQVLAGALMISLVGLLTSCYGLLVVPLSAEFKTGRMVLMFAITIMAISTAVLSPVLGGMMDRVPLRKMMILGVFTLAAGFTALSFATSITQILIIYGVLIGPTNVLIGPVLATVLLSRWFVRRRGTALGIAVAGSSVMTLILPPFVQFLLDNHDWRVALRILTAVLVVIAMFAVALVVERPEDKGFHADGDAEPAETTKKAELAAPISAKAILTDPAFWMIAPVFTLMLAGMKGMITNLVPMAIDVGIKPSSAALLMSIFTFAGLISKTLFAVVADRCNTRYLLAACIVGFTAGLACLTRADAGYAMIALGVSLIGIFAGLSQPLQGILVPRIFGQQVIGRATGLLTFVMLVFSLSSPPAFGLIYDRTGSYAAVFLVLAVLSAATILPLPFIRMHPREVKIEGGAPAITDIEEAAAPLPTVR
jgi:sugar phosphate permease